MKPVIALVATVLYYSPRQSDTATHIPYQKSHLGTRMWGRGEGHDRASHFHPQELHQNFQCLIPSTSHFLKGPFNLTRDSSAHLANIRKRRTTLSDRDGAVASPGRILIFSVHGPGIPWREGIVVCGPGRDGLRGGLSSGGVLVPAGIFCSLVPRFWSLPESQGEWLWLRFANLLAMRR